jgi:hypothetical protein
VTLEEPLDWLHDARLTAVEVAWASATARVTIEVDTALARAGSLPLAETLPSGAERPSDQVGTLVIECEGVERVVVPHEEPWGPSDYVNAARVTSEPSGLRIEMSSGDEIEIRARSVTLNREQLDALS